MSMAASRGNTLRYPRRRSVTAVPGLLLVVLLVALLVVPLVELTARSATASSTTCVTPGVSATMADAFFGTTHGAYQGADYQRAYPLPDGRVLWMLEDAELSGALVHNVGVVQTDNCFQLLTGPNAGDSWLLWDQTTAKQQWFWALGGAISADRASLQLIVEQMNELGPRYLSHTVPTATLLVTIRLSDFAVTAYQPAPANTADVWGFSVTSSTVYTYLYSYCFKQFGFSTLGFDPCEQDVKVGRVPRGHLEQVPQFWDGVRWQADPTRAAVVFGFQTTGHGVNPPQVRFDGSHFTMITQTDDWFSTLGSTVNVYSATRAQGPWTLTKWWWTPFRCGVDVCDTYFASWLADGSGWGISHNVWPGNHQSGLYFPSFYTWVGPPYEMLHHPEFTRITPLRS